ncbi:MAG: hypothetical protein AB8E15_03610 [Bdellovibrionales bacterium]
MQFNENILKKLVDKKTVIINHLSASLNSTDFKNQKEIIEFTKRKREQLLKIEEAIQLIKKHKTQPKVLAEKIKTLIN